MEYRYGNYTIFKIQYHFVFVTKYLEHYFERKGNDNFYTE